MITDMQISDDIRKLERALTYEAKSEYENSYLPSTVLDAVKLSGINSIGRLERIGFTLIRHYGHLATLDFLRPVMTYINSVGMGMIDGSAMIRARHMFETAAPMNWRLNDGPASMARAVGSFLNIGVAMNMAAALNSLGEMIFYIAESSKLTLGRGLTHTLDYEAWMLANDMMINGVACSLIRSQFTWSELENCYKVALETACDILGVE